MYTSKTSICNWKCFFILFQLTGLIQHCACESIITYAIVDLQALKFKKKTCLLEKYEERYSVPSWSFTCKDQKYFLKETDCVFTSVLGNNKIDFRTHVPVFKLKIIKINFYLREKLQERETENSQKTRQINLQREIEREGGLQREIQRGASYIYIYRERDRPRERKRM